MNRLDPPDAVTTLLASGFYKQLLIFYILLSSACESSILVDPKMLRLNSIVRKAAFVWNKLSRYQHHCKFLKLCLYRNVVPVGFNFNFHLSLSIDNVSLNTFCKHVKGHLQCGTTRFPGKSQPSPTGAQILQGTIVFEAQP